MPEARAFRRAGRGKSAPPVRRGESGSRLIRRRPLSYSTGSVWLIAAPILLTTAAVAFRRWPLPATVGHLTVLALLASILCDICLYSFHKIPFTCSYLPGKSRINMAFLYGALLLYGIMFAVRYEREALLDIAGMAPAIAGLLVIAVAARWLTTSNAKDADLQFEEEDSDTIQTLGLR